MTHLDLVMIFQHQGIWVKCQSLPTGNWDCDDFNSFFLGLPTELQAGILCDFVLTVAYFVM